MVRVERRCKRSSVEYVYLERSSLCAGYSIVFAFSVQALSVGRLLPDSQTLLALQQNEGDIILSSMKLTPSNT